ncbi:hypothetical protein Tco_1541680 [Tanacetum coccineum]
MISMRLKKFYKKTGRKLHFDAKEPEEPKALVTLDGEGVDWTDHAEDEQENFALMAYSNLGSDTEVKSCSKECVESYAKLKKFCVEQEKNWCCLVLEIQAYTQALKKVEAQLVTHQKNQLWYEEKIRFMKIDLDDKTDVLTISKNLLADAMSKRDKFGLGYGDQVHDGVLSYENEVFQSVFDSRSSDVEDKPFTETLEYVTEQVVVEPNVVSQPKVWPDAPIIEEYESDSDDEYVIQPSKEQEIPSFASIDTVKHVKTPRETVKEQNTYSPSPKANKRDLNGLMSKRKWGKGTGQGENRPVWNNVQRLNHQNQFVPTAVLTRTGRIPVNTASHNFNSQAVSTSAARKVNADNPQRALKNKRIVDSGCLGQLLVAARQEMCCLSTTRPDVDVTAGKKKIVAVRNAICSRRVYLIGIDMHCVCLANTACLLIVCSLGESATTPHLAALAPHSAIHPAAINASRPLFSYRPFIWIFPDKATTLNRLERSIQIGINNKPIQEYSEASSPQDAPQSSNHGPPFKPPHNHSIFKPLDGVHASLANQMVWDC